MKKSLLCVVLLAAVPALATISKVQSVATWNATGSSCNLSLPGTGSGHLIVLWVTWAPSSLTLNLNYSDPTGNTYASAVGPTIQSASGTVAQIVYAKSIAGGNDPIAFPFNSGSATSVSCVAVEYQGADTMYPLDSVSAGYSYSAGNFLDSGTAAPANASLLVFGAGVVDNASGLIPGSGFTSIQSSAIGTSASAITEQNTAAITTNNVLQRATACVGLPPLPCPSTTGDWLMQMAVFRAASWGLAAGGSPVFAGQSFVTNLGVFTGTNYRSYLSSSLNGFSQSSFSALSLPNDVDVISGGAVIPVGATVTSNVVGIAGYVVNQADTRDVHGKLAQQSNGVSLYGIAEAYNTNSSAWGINTTTGDNTATSNTYIIGYQNDVWVLGTPMSLYADQVTLNGTTGTVPSSALAYVINNNRTDGQKFQTGFEASDNCCGQAFQVGSATGTSPSASQAISFAYWNGVRKTDTNVSVDSSGNYLVAGPTSFKFPSGVFSRLPACSPTYEGAVAPVTDDNTAVAWGSTVTGGGSHHVFAYCDGTNWTIAAK